MVIKMNILVSSCLLGTACRYDGGAKAKEELLALLKDGKHTFVPVCPEQLGGLMTPRPPAERQGKRVVNSEGADVTEAFQRGAEEALRLAKLYGCTAAVLKEHSPSCGSGKIYDGSFCGVLTDGDGMTAALLKQNGIPVIGESELGKIDR